LLDDVPPEQILCVTFTKAAAAEMSQRILHQLASWVSMPDMELQQLLRSSLAVQDAAGAMTRARTLFARTLDTRGGLKIQTLHSFCQSLLTRFPLESGIAPGFATLDDRTEAHLQTEALDSEIARAFGQHDQQFISDLDYLSIRADDDRLLKTIRKFTDALSKADPGAQLTIAGVEPRVRNALGLPLSGDSQDAFQNMLQSGTLDTDNLRHIAKIWLQGSKRVQGHANHLNTWLKAPALDHLEDLRTAFFTDDKPRADSHSTDKSTALLDPDLLVKIGLAQSQIETLVKQLRLYDVAAQTTAALRIALAVLHSIQSAKNALGLVSFNDLIGQVASLLGGSGSDWVRYKLDDQIAHVLVDEAQDTNANQWAILSALTDDFFSGAGAQRQHRSVFVVGDYKQSIFRFQGADPKTYLAEQPKLRQRVENGQQAFLSLDLDISFRSSPAIIDFVNQAITTLGIEKLGSTESIEQHKSHRAGSGGQVTLWPLTPRSKTDIDPEDLQAELDREWEEKPERLTASRIAHQISRWLASDSPERLRGRQIMPQDIMVLVRTRGTIAQALVSDLKTLGVPVAGADRMKLSKQLAVQDLMCSARFCLLPEDDLTLAGLLKSPFFSWSEDQLFDLAHQRPPRQSLWAALQTSEMPMAKTTAEKLRGLLAESDIVMPFQFFSHILERDGGRAALFARLGAEVDDPITAFLDEALAFEQEQAPSLQAFISWMDMNADDHELKRDPDAPRNEVRVMTVHGAKGLEAPIIILADSNQISTKPETVTMLDTNGSILPIWVAKKALQVDLVQQAAEKEQLESLHDYWRLFYVAITRAADRLYFAGWERRDKSTVLSWFEIAANTLDSLENVQSDAVHWPGGRHFILPSTQHQDVASGQVHEAAVVVPEWALTRAPHEPVPPRPLTPSQLGGEELVAFDSPREAQSIARIRGTILHRLFELLPQIDVADRYQAAQSILRHASLPEEEWDALLAEVDTVLQTPAFASVFAPESLAEVPVTALIGERVLSGQIDRLAVTESEVLIVDYKSTARPPKTADLVSSLYVRQMAAYRATLRQIYPAHRIVCALLWTTTPYLMSLPDTLLDEAAASFMSH
jgi:ATP-dependent helicase/nuclease subunit A